jgi:hypothetical protein
MTQQGWTSKHGAQRAAIFRTKGATKTASKLNNLNYKDIIEGIGYKEDKRSKQQTAVNISNTKITDNDKDQFYKSDNKIEKHERAKAREEAKRCHHG